MLGSICGCFYNPRKNIQGKSQLVNESSINDTTYQNDLSASVSLIPNNVNDKELISIYKNGIFVEDYFLSYFDQILNIITSSLNQVYNSKYFSTVANEKNLTNKLKIEDISGIGGNMKDTSPKMVQGLLKFFCYRNKNTSKC